MITQVETESGSIYTFCTVEGSESVQTSVQNSEFVYAVRNNGTHKLRRDSEVIKVFPDFEMEVGKPMILKCEYLGAPTTEEMVTYRVTSPVTRIEYFS